MLRGLKIAMTVEKRLDDILNTKSKVKIIRLFISKGSEFMASGSDVAKSVGLTPPAIHASLKELYDQNVLRRDIVGKQHIYRLNASGRIVKEILKPAFQKERSIKEDISSFLVKKINDCRVAASIKSLILYGSLARGETHYTSDCDIAIIVNDLQSKKKVEDVFVEKISSEFSEYFGLSLDAYIKTCDEFISRMKRNLSPVPSLMKSYTVIYGKDPIDYR